VLTEFSTYTLLLEGRLLPRTKEYKGLSPQSVIYGHRSIKKIPCTFAPLGGTKFSSGLRNGKIRESIPFEFQHGYRTWT